VRDTRSKRQLRYPAIKFSFLTGREGSCPEFETTIKILIRTALNPSRGRPNVPLKRRNEEIHVKKGWRLLLELESASWSLNNKYLTQKNWSFLTKKFLVSNNLGLELDPNSARKHNLSVKNKK
jgi:hypothetical protein